MATCVYVILDTYIHHDTTTPQHHDIKCFDDDRKEKENYWDEEH